jgi:hypothetical protein
LDAQDKKMNTIDQHLQHLEDGINTILQILQACPPINNQPSPAANGKEGRIVGEEEEEAKLCCFLSLYFLGLLTLLSALLLLHTGISMMHCWPTIVSQVSSQPCLLGP